MRHRANFELKGADLSYKCNKLSKMLGLLVGIDLKDLSNAIVMVPLLQELLFVSCRISLYEVL